jgi:lipopolysaccharide export system permease protein
MIPPFFLNIVFFTFVFLLRELLEITNYIVNYKIGVLDVLLFIVYSMPYFLVFVLPMSIMMAVLLTFLRMSGDNEIIAMKSGGVNLYQLLPPVILFCSIGAVMTGFMIIKGLPWGRQAQKELEIRAISSLVEVAIKERTFIDDFKNVMIYVNRVDMKNRRMMDVFIEDRRNRNFIATITAPEGKLDSEPGRPVYHLALKNGIINQIDPDTRSSNTTRFDVFEMNLDLQKKVMGNHQGEKDEKEMSLRELKTYIRNDVKKDSRYYVVLLEYHKKFSIPFACIALGLLAVPLGIVSRLSKRSFGLTLGLAFFLFYYLMLSAGLVFGEAGKYPPALGMWLPNVVIGAIGLYLIRRTVQEDSPIRLDILFSRFWRVCVSRMRK